MRIEVRRLGDADVVLISGTLDLRTVASLRAVLDAQVSGGRTELIVDLAGVRLLDAGAIGMLAGMAARVGRLGGCLRAVRAHGICLDALAITGMDKALRAYDEPADLVDRFVPGACSRRPDGASGGDPRAGDRDHHPVWCGSRDITVSVLLAAVSALAPLASERVDLRTQIIEDHIPFARRMAGRFRDRGEPAEDLVQVAMLGLVNAVDGFDPDKGAEFVGYAGPTMDGEIRRYFRDKSWRIRIPRRLQELGGEVRRAQAELVQRGISPTTAQIARHLGVGEAEVAESMDAIRACRVLTLPAGGDDQLGLGGGADDPDLEAVDNREAVRTLLARLSEREKRIVELRFFDEMSQAQIGRELGISQMHVSRLLAGALSTLRRCAAGAPG